MFICTYIYIYIYIYIHTYAHTRLIPVYLNCTGVDIVSVVNLDLGTLEVRRDDPPCDGEDDTRIKRKSLFQQTPIKRTVDDEARNKPLNSAATGCHKQFHRSYFAV